MLFKYTGISNAGKKVTGKIEATNKKEAIQKITQKGIFYQSIKNDSPSIISQISFKKKEFISNKVLSGLSRDLAIYLQSGISIFNAIKLASSQYQKQKKIALFLNSIGTFLDEGKSFSSSLEAQTIYEIPLFFRQSIKVSEDGGILADVLKELAKFLKEQEKINKQIGSAMAYPIFIILVSMLMVSFMMVIVVPKIVSIFEDMDKALPPITLFVLNLSNVLSSYWHLMLIALVVFIIGFQALLKYSSKFKYIVHFLLLKILFFGKTLEYSELGRFAYMCSVLSRSGLPLVQAINLSAKILKNSVIANLFEECATKVVEGTKLSQALNHQRRYNIDKSFIQSIALGEETSELERILNNISNLYFEENQDRINIFLSLLEPLLMLLVGAIVGFIVVAMLLPIFSLNLG